MFSLGRIYSECIWWRWIRSTLKIIPSFPKHGCFLDNFPISDRKPCHLQKITKNVSLWSLRLTAKAKESFWLSKRMKSKMENTMSFRNMSPHLFLLMGLNLISEFMSYSAEPIRWDFTSMNKVWQDLPLRNMKPLINLIWKT